MANVEQKIMAVFEADTSRLDAAIEKTEAKARGAAANMRVPLEPASVSGPVSPSVRAPAIDPIAALERELAQTRGPGSGAGLADSALGVQRTQAVAAEAAQATFATEEIEKFGAELEKADGKAKSLRDRFIEFGDAADKEIGAVKRAAGDLFDVVGIGAAVFGGLYAAVEALNEISLQKIRDEIDRLGNTARFLMDQLGEGLTESKEAKQLGRASEVATMNANADEVAAQARATKDPKERARLEGLAGRMRNEAGLRQRMFDSETESEQIAKTRANAEAGIEDRIRTEIELADLKRQRDALSVRLAQEEQVTKEGRRGAVILPRDLVPIRAEEGWLTAEIRTLESTLAEFPEGTYDSMLESAEKQEMARVAKDAAAVAAVNNPEIKVDARNARITINEKITTSDPSRLAGQTLVSAYRAVVRHPLRSSVMAPTGRPR